MHYLLFYEVAEDYVSRRAEFRDAHLQKAWEASERGELVLAGALANPVDSAVLLFRGDSPEVAEKFARADPYVTSGAVKRWHVREWTTVAGEDAATPVRPKTASAGMKTVKDLVIRDLEVSVDKNLSPGYMLIGQKFIDAYYADAVYTYGGDGWKLHGRINPDMLFDIKTRKPDPKKPDPKKTDPKKP